MTKEDWLNAPAEGDRTDKEDGDYVYDPDVLGEDYCGIQEESAEYEAAVTAFLEQMKADGIDVSDRVINDCLIRSRGVAKLCINKLTPVDAEYVVRNNGTEKSNSSNNHFTKGICGAGRIGVAYKTCDDLNFPTAAFEIVTGFLIR